MNQMHTKSLANTKTAPINFLLVDDDVVSIMAIKRALKKLKILNPVTVAHDGEEALEILRGACGREGLEAPYLVTLDINMPRMDGLEFLEQIRKDDHLRRAVVFVLSTSDAPKDIDAAYAQNIAGYIVKDDLGDSFSKALDMLDTYSKVVELPI